MEYRYRKKSFSFKAWRPAFAPTEGGGIRAAFGLEGMITILQDCVVITGYVSSPSVIPSLGTFPDAVAWACAELYDNEERIARQLFSRSPHGEVFPTDWDRGMNRYLGGVSLPLPQPPRRLTLKLSCGMIHEVGEGRTAFFPRSKTFFIDVESVGAPNVTPGRNSWHDLWQGSALFQKISYDEHPLFFMRRDDQP